MTRLLSLALLVLTMLVSFPVPAAAQFPWTVPDVLVPRPPRRPSSAMPRPNSLDDVPRHVVSTNPGALLFVTPSIEYELRTLPFLTLGAGASTTLWTFGHTAVNREALIRVFPAGMAFNGPSIGARVGATRISQVGDVRTWAFEGGYTSTPSRHTYVSLSGGIRHLDVGPSDGVGEFHPILRMNLGFGF